MVAFTNTIFIILLMKILDGFLRVISKTSFTFGAELEEISLYFFCGTLITVRYLQFIRDMSPELLEESEIDARFKMLFQQDGVPPHLHRIMRSYLTDRFEDRWIDRGAERP